MIHPKTIVTLAACSLFPVLVACSGADAQGTKPPPITKGTSAVSATPTPSAKVLYYPKPAKEEGTVPSEAYKSKFALWEQTAPRTQGALVLDEYCKNGYENEEWKQKCAQKN